MITPGHGAPQLSGQEIPRTVITLKSNLLPIAFDEAQYLLNLDSGSFPRFLMRFLETLIHCIALGSEVCNSYQYDHDTARSYILSSEEGITIRFCLEYEIM